MVERTGAGDPVRVIPLLWRRGLKKSRSGLRLGDIVEAGIAVADEAGIDDVSMRKVADRLQVGTMSLYAHVPSKAELVELMVDSVFAEVSYDRDRGDPVQWRAQLEAIAEKNWDLLARHRWLLDIDITRPPLGPGTIGKYDAELRALDGTGLDEVEMDQVLGLILDHTRSSARQAFAAENQVTEAAGATDSDWWSQSGPLLASVIDTEKYPYASRIGAAAGQAYGAPSDSQRAYTFGLHTLLAGVESLIDQRTPGAAP